MRLIWHCPYCVSVCVCSCKILFRDLNAQELICGMHQISCKHRSSRCDLLLFSCVQEQPLYRLIISEACNLTIDPHQLPLLYLTVRFSQSHSSSLTVEVCLMNTFTFTHLLERGYINTGLSNLFLHLKRKSIIASEWGVSLWSCEMFAVVQSFVRVSISFYDQVSQVFNRYAFFLNPLSCSGQWLLSGETSSQ